MKFEILLLCICGCKIVFGEMYAAMVDIKDLLEFVKQNSVCNYTLDTFIHNEELKLQEYNNILHRLEDFHNFDETYDEAESVAQPTVAYKLFRNALMLERTLNDVLQMERTSEKLSSFNESLFLNVIDRLPSEDDLNGTANAITRLQEVYDIPISDVISGVLYNHSSRPLTSSEVMDIITYTSENGILGRLPHNRTLNWLNELNRTAFIRSSNVELYSQILVKMAEVYIKSKCHCSVEFSLVFDEWKKHGLQIIDIYDTMKRHIDKCKTKYSKGRCLLLNNSHSKAKAENMYALCREATAFPDRTQFSLQLSSRRLTCHLEHNNHPVLILNPMKVELLNKDTPYIAILHDVIRDHEIEFLKSAARPFLKRGTVATKAGKLKSEVKISKSVVFKRKITGVLSTPAKKFRNRLVAKTGLNSRGMEPLHVTNYGLGGIYNVHVDFPTINIIQNFTEAGDARLVTVIHYLTDVEDGGMTVFPELEIASPAKKGNALMFFNLFRNGTGDVHTSHASCPVIYGNKWISVQWVTRYHQEILYPCSTNRWE